MRLDRGSGYKGCKGSDEITQKGEFGALRPERGNTCTMTLMWYYVARCWVLENVVKMLCGVLWMLWYVEFSENRKNQTRLKKIRPA
jgi:hypothetical protein